jgi:GntR family transcriptional regulator of vanillate catabolism
MATHQEQAAIQLRAMILNGTLSPGQRLTETALSEQLHISRTPIRYALTVLAQEGLLIKPDKRGYAVGSFCLDDVLGAIDVRGVLEGLAAKTLAERGVGRELSARLRECLATGDALLAKGHLLPEDEANYSEMNRRFHSLITDGAGNHALGHILAANGSVPFAAAGALAFERARFASQLKILTYAHQQHHAIVSALENGEGLRAEALMREHTNVSKQSLNMAEHILFRDSAQPQAAPSLSCVGSAQGGAAGAVSMNQQDQIVSRLREMILSGEIAPGTRLLEVALAANLNVSRTPVRHAIKILESEGLLASNGARGYQVRRFSLDDMAGAIEVRGVLEGLAARTLAMQALPPAVQRQLERCVDDGERLIRKGVLHSGDQQQFATINVRFHESLVQAAGIRALSNAIALNDRLPFAAAAAVAMHLQAPGAQAPQFRLVQDAQAQHSAIYQAVSLRQGARVDALMREHSCLAIETMRLVMASHADQPGAGRTYSVRPGSIPAST